MNASWSRFIATAVLFCGYLVIDSNLPDRAHAIITRHDTGYTRYYAREWDYPAVFPLGTDGFLHTCVASLIADTWALTAAHCIQESGMAQAISSEEGYVVKISQQSKPVAEYYLHPAWQGGVSGSPSETDLALIRLHSSVDGVKPLSLYAGEAEAGEQMTFLGWGYTGTGNHPRRTRDGQLRKAHNRVVAVSEAWLRFDFESPTQSQSALPLEGVPGLGDSGSPALLRVDNRDCLAGVAIGELGAPSANDWGKYGARVIYQRVSRQLAWIQQVIGDSYDVTQSCISSHQ